MLIVKKILLTLFLPPFSPILIGAIGLWILKSHRKLGYGLIMICLISIYALSTPFVAGKLIETLEWYPPVDNARLFRAQAIVVLGGGSYRDAPEYGGDTIGHVSLERLRYGVALHRRSNLPLLLTGGSPDGGKAEAEIMRQSAQTDFTTEVRWVETESNDTSENALLSSTLLKQAGITRIALVTNAWHEPRAVRHFEGAGFEVIPAPINFHSRNFALVHLLTDAGALAISTRAIHEWLGIIIQHAKDISRLESRFGQTQFLHEFHLLSHHHDEDAIFSNRLHDGYLCSARLVSPELPRLTLIDIEFTG